MTDLRTAAQQALEALEAFLSDELRPYEAAKTAANIRVALAEPVAWGGDPSVQDYSSCYPEPVQEPVNYTTGHCKNRKQKGGCQLHNLQCGWPDCDRRPTHPLQRTKTNQCGETCERAKLCPACLTAL